MKLATETNSVNRETLRSVRTTWVDLRKGINSTIKENKNVLPKKVKSWIEKFDSMDLEMREFYNQKSA